MNEGIPPPAEASPKEFKKPALPRRDFLKMVGGTGAFLAAQGVVNVWPLQAQAIANRRNIIIFTTDQQRDLQWFPDGWEADNLPALTRLKSKGVSFSSAYTNTAMCTPARNTMFTGLYPAQHASKDTLTEDMSQSASEHQLDPAIPNIGTVLAEAGYDVVWKGKWHLSKGVELDDGTHVEDDIARYGITKWNSPDAGGDAQLKNFGGGNTDHDGRFLDGSTWQAQVGDDIFTQAAGPVDADNEEESALAFLRDRITNPTDRPFCLIVCLINPHDVLSFPGISVANGGNGTYTEGGYSAGWIDATWSSEQKISLPPTADESLLTNYKPTSQAAFLAISAAGLGATPLPKDKLDYLNFYGNLMKLGDRNLAKVLDLLDGLDPSVEASKAQALRDNSWVIFTSDHGDMGMSHGGLRQKSFNFYEETGRIPLVWSNSVDFPTGQICDKLVSHVDFLPTLCTMAGLNPKRYRFKGVDYSSLVKNPAGSAVQDHILFTFDDIWSGQEAAGFPNGIVPAPNRIQALREKDYKYVYYFDGTGVASPQDEFYDMRTLAQGGTDTDASTGLAKEFLNISSWAVARGQTAPSAALEKERSRMEAKLKKVVKTKLAPLPKRPPVSPQDFKVELVNWTDSFGTPQSALQITWLSRSTTQYQLQFSRDQKNWTNAGEPVRGNNGPMLISEPVNDFKAFYRLAWSRA